MSPLCTIRSLSFATPSAVALIAACIAATGLLVTSASRGQVGQVPGPTGAGPAAGQQSAEPINPETLSCRDLKARLQTTGELRILSGPRGGWADTFYGPAVPRCQFYQMPVFTYVRTNDGRCGIGYICVDKLSFD